MKANKILGVVLALVLAVGLAAIVSTPAASQEVPTSALTSNTGYRAVATQTLTVTSATAVIIGTIPAGCHTVTVIASTAGDLNYGPSTVGTSTVWPYIASGGMKDFEGITSRNPPIYFRPRGGVATTTTVGIIAK
jgi:hypothetical protein